MLLENPAVAGFSKITISLLIDVYSSTVDLQIRRSALQTIFKVVSTLSFDTLQTVVKNIELSLLLSSILSQRDHSSLTLGALEIATVLLKKLPNIYIVSFFRGGIIEEIESIKKDGEDELAKKEEEKSNKPKPISASVLSLAPSISPSPESALSSSSLSVSAPVSALDSGSSGTATSTSVLPPTPSGPADIVSGASSATTSVNPLQIRSNLRNILNNDDDITNSGEHQESDEDHDEEEEEDDDDEEEDSDANYSDESNCRYASFFSDLRPMILDESKELLHIYSDLAKSQDFEKEMKQELNHLTELGEKFLTQNNLEESFKEFARIIGEVSEFELLCSHILRSLLTILTTGTKEEIYKTRKLFLKSFLESGSSKPFEVLIERLNESLSRFERFEVLTSDYSGLNSGPSSLNRQLRISLTPYFKGKHATTSSSSSSNTNTNTNSNGSSNNNSNSNSTSGNNQSNSKNQRSIVISIQAVASFKDIDEFYKAKIQTEHNIFGLRSDIFTQILNSATEPTESEETSEAKAEEKDADGDSQMIDSPMTSNSTKDVTSSASACTPTNTGTNSTAQTSTSNTNNNTVATATSSTATDSDPDADGDSNNNNLSSSIISTASSQPDDENNNIESTTIAPVASSSSSSQTALATTASATATTTETSGVRGSPWYLEFYIDDQVIPHNVTVYGAIYKSILAKEKEKVAKGEKVAITNPAQTIWNTHQKIWFKKRSGERPKLKTPSLEAEKIDPIMQVPTSFGTNPSVAIVIRLLNTLFEMNNNISDVFGPQNPDGIAPLNISKFSNSKLTAKLNRQLEEPMIVVSGLIPMWAIDACRLYPFLFPFESRLLFLHSTSFGYFRLMNKWQSESNENGRRQMGQLLRQKVRISRSHMLQSAMKVLSIYGASSYVLEVEFFEDVGTGLGPTLEFYATVSKKFTLKKLGIWRDDNGNPSSPYSFSSQGLFPLPQHPKVFKSSAGKKILATFKSLGIFVARSMLDSRIIDLNFNPLFFRLAGIDRNKTKSDEGSLGNIGTVYLVDKHTGHSLELLKKFADAKDEILRQNKGDVEEQIANITIDGASVKDLALDFTLPGRSDVDLIPNGSMVEVTIDNISEYIQRVTDLTLGVGVILQIEAFKEGFSQVFSYSALSTFTAEEIVVMCGQGEADWSYETLCAVAKADHGYKMDSRVVKDLFEVMSHFSIDERKAFLQFVTGSPNLPIGGFKALRPPFTIVCRESEAPLTPDEYLPTVMTCVNYFKLPNYSSKEVLKERILTAIKEGSGSFLLS